MKLDEIFSFDNLWRAHKLCRKNKQHKRATVMFEIEMGANINKLAKSLAKRRFKFGKCRVFKVYDPKERLIEAPAYKDRVVMMCFCKNVLEPKLERRLIYDNAASRIGKGTNFAIRRLHSFMRKLYINNPDKVGYYLKCDISKYYQNINHQILLQKLQKEGFSDDEMWFMEKAINMREGKGLPLGNQTSQWFAIFYLDSLDRLIKEKLKVGCYIRYMDDFVLLDTDKPYLQHCLNEIKKHCREKLDLSLNKKTQIGKLSNGIDFLGFNHTLGCSGKIMVKLRAAAKERQKGYIKSINHYYQQGLLDDNYLHIREKAYQEYMKMTKEFKFVRNAFNKMRCVCRQKACNKIKKVV